MKKNKYALILQNGEKFSYDELNEFCTKFNKTINVRKLLLIRCEICMETIIVYVASVKNRIPVMLMEMKVDCRKIVNQYQPEYIWQNFSQDRINGYKVVWKYGKYVLLQREKSISYEINNDLAILLSTSGSIGSEKYVRISYKNIECSTKAIVSSLKIKSSDVTIVMLPVSYVYGLSVINSYLYVGATLLVPSLPFIHTEFWDFFNYNCGTSIYGVPYTFEIMKKLNIFGKGIPKLKLVAVAGGKISSETEKYILDKAHEQKFEYASMYGQTETTGRIASGFINKFPEKVGSAGKVLSIGNIKVEGTELVYCGSNVSMGYSKGFNDLSKGDEFFGVIRTGDEGIIDEDGYLYIKGRISRIAKINGYRVTLDELESRMSKILGLDCICVEKEGRIGVVVEKKEGCISENDILKILNEQTKLNEKLFYIKFVKELLRNSNGKIMYEENLK